MLGPGTYRLAEGLLQLTTTLGGELSGAAVYLLDGAGGIQARGGDRSAPEPHFVPAAAGGLQVEGLATGRVGELAVVHDYGGCDSAFVFVSADRQGSSAAALREFARRLAEMLEAGIQAEFETEDTTAHLLSLFEQIRAIHDLADSLPDCARIEDLAELCLRSLLVALGARSAYLFMRMPETPDRVQVLGIAAAGGSLSQYEAAFDPDVGGPVERALLEGKESYGPIALAEQQQDEWLQLGRTTHLCIPISFGSEERRQHLGCFLVLDRVSGELDFGSPDAEIVQSVGVLVGLVVGTQRQAHVQNQLAVARHIQKTLLPKGPPEWSGLRLASANRSANQVGGDYFDFIETGWGAKLCLIADVSGHDLASGMAMLMGRSELRGAAQRESSPGQMLEAVASSMFEDLSCNELFLTVFCLSFEERTQDGSWRLRWANAGHNPPLVLRRDGTIEWLDSGGPMIGFMPKLDYDDEELRLWPGDLALLYTDGVTEAPDRDGELLDEDGLLAILEGLRGRSAPEVLGGILRAVDERSGERSTHDDVTVLVAEVLDAETCTEEDE